MTMVAFDVDARIFRTMWHSLLRPADVVLAALRADFSNYLSPIRVFVSLFGFTLIVYAMVDIPVAMNLDGIEAGLAPGQIEAWLGDLDRASVNAALNDRLSLLIWPIQIFSTLPFIIALKLFRPSLKFWAHVMVYLVATNASMAIQVGTMPIASLGIGYLVATSFLSVIVYLIVKARLLTAFYAKTAEGVAVRLCIIFVMIFVALFINSGTQFLAAFWVLETEYGLSLPELYASP